MSIQSLVILVILPTVLAIDTSTQSLFVVEIVNSNNFIPKEKKFHKKICTGTIISKDWVLSPGICMDEADDPSKIQIFPGREKGPKSIRLIYGVKLFKRFPNMKTILHLVDNLEEKVFNTVYSYEGNIGLFQLEKQITEDNRIHSLTKNPEVSRELILVRHGYPFLNGTTIQYISFKLTDCGRTDAKLICAKPSLRAGGRIYVGHSDIGAPLLNSDDKVVGILSDFFPEGDDYSPVPNFAFTKTQAYITWITEVSGITL